MRAFGTDKQPQEYALRALIQFYNKRNYAAHLAPLPSPEPSSAHKRSNSASAMILDDPALLPHPPPHLRSSTSSETDVFPPRSTLPYNPDGMLEFWLHEYEDVLGEVFGEGVSYDEEGSGAPGPAEKDDPAWNRLGEIMKAKGGPTEDDSISDSESVVSIGVLGDGARLQDLAIGMNEEGLRLQRRQSGNENTWEVSLPYCNKEKRG